MRDRVFAIPPAPEYVAPLELAVEVHQAGLEPLEHAAHLVQLADAGGDLARHFIYLTAQRDLLGRLTPVGPSAPGGDLVTVNKLAPSGMELHEVGDDATHQWQRPVGLFEGEVGMRQGLIRLLNGPLRRREARIDVP